MFLLAWVPHAVPLQWEANALATSKRPETARLVDVRLQSGGKNHLAVATN